MKSIRTVVFALLSSVLLAPLALAIGLPTRSNNVQIGTVTAVRSVSIDWESANGNLFAVVDTTAGDWFVYRSTDGGASWSETANWGGTDTTEVDAVVVGSYVYVGYTTELDSVARLRRASSSTGLMDEVYDYVTVFDAGASGVTVEEIALAANSFDNDNTLWYFVLTSDHVVHAYFCSVASCATVGSSTTGATNASHGLDATWNIGYDGHTPSHIYVLFSFVTTADEVHVYKLVNGVGWQASNVQFGATSAKTTGLAAFRDRFMIVFSYPAPGGPDARFAYSQGGGGWSVGTFGDADYANGPYYTPMAAAGRSGFGLFLQQDAGGLPGDDLYWFGERRNFGGAFGQWATMNQYDFNFGPPEFTSDLRWMGAGWGTAYRCAASKAWFAWSPSIHFSGFEVAGLDEWSARIVGP